MNRRGFLQGLIAAPAVITTPGLLMPVKAAPLGYPFRAYGFGYRNHVWRFADGTEHVFAYDPAGREAVRLG